MTDSALSIVERQLDDVTVLALTGQILIDDGDLVFGRKIRDLIERGHVEIVVDLGGVTYIDSSGVGMLVGKLKGVREKGGDIRLLHVTTRGQRLFGMLKILTVFEVFEDEAQAVRSFAARPGGEATSARPPHTKVVSLLDADRHRVRADERLDARGRKPGVLHPARAVGAGVVEASRRLDEHVQAHQQVQTHSSTDRRR